MKVNVDVLVLIKSSKITAKFSGDNQSMESVRKSISNLYIQATMFPLQKFTIQMFRST